MKNLPNKKVLPPSWLQVYSKVFVLFVGLLIFAGAMVKSTESGLAVPDWPLSYGMLFPPMVGGILYEHSHRLMASMIGIMTIFMIIFVFSSRLSSNVKKLSLLCLLVVILQGLLGGITVLFYLPPAVSIAHAILAQTFFLLSILLAYNLSTEFFESTSVDHQSKKSLVFCVFILLSLLYIQLLIGGLMRHTGSGLAIYDFPKSAGQLLPSFNNVMLRTINDWRFMHNMDSVNMFQVVIHFVHRFFAIIILLSFLLFTFFHRKILQINPKVQSTIYWIFMLFFLQILLGAMTIWSQKMPFLSSLHLTLGAILLGATLLLFLRIRAFL